MSRDRYVRLIEEFCRLSQLDEPARITQGGAIEFDDVAFSLLFSEKINPGALLAYCEFGPLPSGHETEALRILMQKNLHRFDGDGGPAFSLSAAGNVISAHRLPLADARAQQLFDLLAGVADKAKQWRKNFRMNTQPPGSSSSQRARRPVRFEAARPQQTPE